MEKREKRREQALERIGGVKTEVGGRSDIKEEPPATPEMADSPTVMQVRTQGHTTLFFKCFSHRLQGSWLYQHPPNNVFSHRNFPISTL